MRNIRKTRLFLLLMTVFLFILTACGGEEAKEPEALKVKDGTYEGEGTGFGGPLRVSVTVADGKITAVEVPEHKESSPVSSRAIPLLEERIIEAQTPQVDSVSAASFTSFGVKTAVAAALKEAGQDFGEIEFFVAEEEDKEPKKLDDVETKIVIVGGGPAGLSAAISAKEAGVDDIIVIEKLDILSGNGKFDMNFFDLINSQAQKEAGIEIGAEEFIEMKENTTDSDARVAVWAEENMKLDEWFRSMGIELNYAYGTTNHMREEDEYAGEHIQDHLEKKVQELAIDVRTGTKGLDLIMEDGKATGVSVENKDGTYHIKADAVIIATGGFASNKDLLAKYAPGAESLGTSNQIGTTGDFVDVFEKNDMQLGNMDRLNIFAFTIRKTRDLTGGADDFLLVNKEGNRFVTEKGRGLEFGHLIAEQTGGSAYYIYDQAGHDSVYRLQKHAALGYHEKADTLEELAEKLGIDAVNLTQSVQTYNDAIQNGKEDPFRGENVFERPFAEEGPYYGVEVVSAVHMTLGGVVADENGQVLNNANEPVEGLYAAGEVTDVSGAFNAAILFGRISGQKAGEYVLAQ